MKVPQLAKHLVELNDRTVISTLQSLLFVMKKFGKSLSNPTVLDFLEKNLPDVVVIYRLLWWSRSTIHQCQQLLVSVARALDYNHLDIMSSSQELALDLLWDDLSDQYNSGTIWLSVVGKWKVYKRSLEGDLSKLINN